MSKLNIFLFFFIICEPITSNAMNNTSSVDDITKITKQFANLAINLQLHKDIAKPSKFTLRKWLELYPQVLCSFYDVFPSGSFKKALDEYLISFLSEKATNRSFTYWFNQLALGNLRKKVVYSLFSLLENSLETKNYDQQFSARLIVLNPNSIIKTIVIILHHRNIKLVKGSVTNHLNLKDIIDAEENNELRYSLIFREKEKTLPLEHLLELTPYIYDTDAIKVLSLNFNRLESLPETIYVLSDLEEIYLVGNKLQTLPQSLLLLPKLKKIKVDASLYAKLSTDFVDKLKAKKVKIKVED